MFGVAVCYSAQFYICYTACRPFVNLFTINMVIGFVIWKFSGLFVNLCGHQVEDTTTFLLLQNPQVSVHYRLCLHIGYVYQSLVNFFSPALGI
jgi:hypothetical protein